MIEILLTNNPGPGWYTKNPKHRNCLFNREIIQLVRESKFDKIPEVAKRLYGSEFDVSGANQLMIWYMYEDAIFQVENYNGREMVIKLDRDNWIFASDESVKT